jgi:hypothetical protein
MWLLTAPYCVDARVNSGGTALSPEHAKQALQTAFQNWLAWALCQGGCVAWYFYVL